MIVIINLYIFIYIVRFREKLNDCLVAWLADVMS
jgi:hypothetical protein